MFQLVFNIDSKLNEISRRRYSFWMALGDIGGFFDGIRLLISMIMTPVGGALFMKDALRNKLYASNIIVSG